MNIYGRMAGYFIANKKLTLLLVLALVLWGMISFIITPKQYNPDIVAPAFHIAVSFPGATVDEVYQVITKPLEDVLNEIPGVENIYSRSMHGGFSSVVVEFYVGEDLEKSMITLRQRIASRLDLAPLGIEAPYISSIDPEDLPIKTLALYSNDLAGIELRRRAYYLKEELKRVPGTSRIRVHGGRQREFQIILDPDRMRETQTSLNEIDLMLKNTSLLKVLGLIKTADAYYHIETQEQVVTTEDIEDIVIISNIEEQLRIKDIARVVETEKEHESYVTYRKKDAPVDNVVFLSIAKKKGENIVSVSARLDAELTMLQERVPYLKNVSIDVVRDEGRVAKEEITELVINLLQAVSIVFLVLLLFLNYRAALIVAGGIPIILLTVIALGNIFGYTINRITLFALILSLGMLVDSATVVVENIVKNRIQYPELEKEKLIPQSVSEIGVGLFLSTLTTIIAFIPMKFISGMMGPYIGPLPFFVSSALVVALLFAYSMNPWLASIFCQTTSLSTAIDRCGFLCRVRKGAIALYDRVLSTLLTSPRKRRFFLLVCFLTLLGALALFPLRHVRFRMLPKADREQLYVHVDLDRGTSIERTFHVEERLVEALLKEEFVESVQSFIGESPILDFNGLFKGVSQRDGLHQITARIRLTHPYERTIKSEELALHYRQVIRDALREESDMRLKIIEDPPGPPVRSTVLLNVKTSNPDLLTRVTKDIERKITSIEGVTDIDISLEEERNKYVLMINKREAARAKMSVGVIASQLETVFSGKVIGVYHSNYNYEQEYITLKFDRDLRDSIDDLEKISIANLLGNHVPLSQFISVEEVPQEDVIRNDNRERVAYISGEMAKRSIAYAAIDMLMVLNDYSVPGMQTELIERSLLHTEYIVNGVDRLIIEIDGEWDLTVKVFRDLGIAMMVAIVLIYLILVAQFKTFRMPLLIMATIPLSLIGVLPAFAVLFNVWGVYFSATSMIGVIALAGIVVNNAIILIEYTMQAIPRYATLKETLRDACQARLRPILLTSITTVLGSLVIATDPVWSGLSWSIVFGLSLSALLTLVVFPALVYEVLGEKWFNECKE